MGTYVRYYCPLKKQQIAPGDVNGGTCKVQFQPERDDIGRLLVHLLSGSGEGPYWYMVCLAHDSTPRHPDGGLPDYDEVREFEDVTKAAIESYNEAHPESKPFTYGPPAHRLRPLPLVEDRTPAQRAADGDLDDEELPS